MSNTLKVNINNQCGSSISKTTDSTTGGNLEINNGLITSGTNDLAFTGSSGAMSGCGGSVTYGLPDGMSQLVIMYNMSYTSNCCYVVPLLQNATTPTQGCDEYYVTSTDALLVWDKSMSVTLNLYSV